MPECPRCHQQVAAQAVTCPHCRTALKAYGHPGVPLYRAAEETTLCQSCTYDADDTCTFPQRPHATACTLYHDRTQPIAPTYRPDPASLLKIWWRRHLGWVLLAAVVLVSLLLALSGR